MLTKSAKAKARRLQNKVRDRVLDFFPELKPDDVKPAIMGETGVDLKLSPLARKQFPYAVECRNREAINIWQSIKDSEDNAVKEKLTSVLVIARNNTPEPYVVIPLATFLLLARALNLCETNVYNTVRDLPRGASFEEIEKHLCRTLKTSEEKN